MKSLALLLALLPTTAFADFQCTIAQQCGMGQCEAFQGEPVVVHEAGDLYEVTFGGQIYEGYVTSTLEGLAQLDIVVPPQQGTSALISIFENGTTAMTFHAMTDGGVIAVTGYGDCTGEGG